MRLQGLFLGLALTCATLAAHAQVPNIELRDFDGQAHNVSEFIGKGKWTIVAIWAHDCGVCEKELGSMSAFHAAHRDRNAIVLGVTIDGMAQVDKARAFAARHALPFINLVAEPDADVLAKFGGGAFVGTPTHYFYDPIGRIVGRKIGPLPKADLEAFIEAFEASHHAKPLQ